VIAVILAAGRGTRLGAIGRDTPKPLVPVAGVPVIERILDALEVDGFADVVVVTGHRADEVEQHLATRPLRFVRQSEPEGTAHAVRAAHDAVGDSPFLVTWVDVLVEPGTYRRVWAATGDVDGAVAVNHLDDLSAGGAVAVDDDMVTRVTEKPGPVAGWNLTGVLALDAAVWPYVEAVGRSVRGEYELPDALNAWIGGGARISAVAVEGAVFEIGTPEGLSAASAAYSGETRSR
jgi:NDP-sugar pyrophosphorylase family protein